MRFLACLGCALAGAACGQTSKKTGDGADASSGSGGSSAASGSGSGGETAATTTSASNVSTRSNASTTGRGTQTSAGGAPGTGGSGGLETGGGAGEPNRGDCDPDVAFRVESFIASVARVAGTVEQLTSDLQGVCYGIATGFGQTPPAADEPPSADDVDAACTVAAAAIDVAADGIEDSISYSQDGGCGCAGNAEAGAECLSACVPGPATIEQFCDHLCLAESYSRAACGQCTAGVSADDPSFVEVMDPHLPVLFPLRSHASQMSQATSHLSEIGPDLVVELDASCLEAFETHLSASRSALAEANATLAVLQSSAEEVVNASAPD